MNARRRTPSIEREKDALLSNVVDQLDAARLQRGMTVADVARASGVAKSCIVRQRKTLSNPSLATMVAQAMALGGHLEIAFVPNGLPDEHTTAAGR